MNENISVAPNIVNGYICAYDSVMGLSHSNAFIRLAQEKLPDVNLLDEFDKIRLQSNDINDIPMSWLAEFWNGLRTYYPLEKHGIGLSRQIGQAWWQGANPLTESYWRYPWISTLVSGQIMKAIEDNIHNAEIRRNRTLMLSIALTPLAQFFRDHFHCKIDVQVIDDKHVMFHVVNTPLTLDNDPNFRMFWGVLDGFCLWLSSPHYKNPIIQVDEELSTHNKIIIRYGKKENKS